MTSARRIWRSSRGIGPLGILAVGSVLLFTTPASAATGPAAGTATITAPGGATAHGATAAPALGSGSADTPFTVTLPANAACPGDTAHRGYHVYSYLVPAGTNLASVTFVNFPSKGYGLVNSFGRYYGAINTAENTGQIIGIPNNFEWGPLVTSGGGRLPISTLIDGPNQGVWEAGIACANTHGVVTTNWNTQVTFSAGGHTTSGLTWKATPGTHSGTGAKAVQAGHGPTVAGTAVHQATAGTAGRGPVVATGHHSPTAHGAHTHGQAPATHSRASTNGPTEQVNSGGTTSPSSVTGLPLAATVAGALALAACAALALRRKWRPGTVSTTHRSVS